MESSRLTLHRRYARRAPHPTARVVDRGALLAAIHAEIAAEACARMPVQRHDATGWPICRHCQQSCTGAYAGHIACVRCDRSHRLAALAGA